MASLASVHLPFAGQTYQDKTLNANAQDAINLYPMRTKSAQYSDKKIGQAAPEDIVMYPSPGYKFLRNIGSGQIRGEFVINTILYVICGNTLFEFIPTSTSNDLTQGVFNNIGTLNTNIGICSIICNTVQLIISDGQFGYTYTFSSNTFAVIATSGSFPALGVTNFTYMDGYALAAAQNSKTVIQSDVLDGTTYGAQAFNTITSFADNIIGVFSDELQLYVFGPKITEVQGDAGTIPYAFQKVPNVLIQAGCAAVNSICKSGNTIIFLASDISGKSYVAALDGYSTKVLSTPPINEAMERYTTVSDAYAYVYREGDNQFYVITFPSASATWAYDIKMDMWHKRSINGGQDLPQCCILWQGLQIIGDLNGNLYQMSQDYGYYSVGNSGVDIPLTRSRTCSHVASEGKTLFINELWIHIQAGGGFFADPNLSPQPIPASIAAIVQQANGNGSVSFTSPTNVNNTIVVPILFDDNTTTVTSITDNLGQTYTQSGAYAVDNIGAWGTDIWYCPNTLAGVTTINVTISSGLTSTFKIMEISGLLTAASVDKIGILNNGASTLTPQTAAITPTATNDFVVTVFNSDDLANSVNPPYTLDSTETVATTILPSPITSSAIFNVSSPVTYCASTIAFFALPNSAVTPLATLEVSKDYGRTWTVVGTRSMGATGQYQKRLVWRNLGRFRQNATFRLTITDPVYTYILSAEGQIKVGAK